MHFWITWPTIMKPDLVVFRWATLKLLSCVYDRCPYVNRNMVSGVGFRPNCRGLLLSFEVSNSNSSSVIGRLTKVYSLRSKLCLDRCALHEKYHDCCQYYCKNFFVAVSSWPLHPGENWKSFRPDEMEVHQLAAGIHKKAHEVRVASLLNAIGTKGMDIYETFQWENSSDALKLGRVLEKFEEFCSCL